MIEWMSTAAVAVMVMPMLELVLFEAGMKMMLTADLLAGEGGEADPSCSRMTEDDEPHSRR